MILETLFVALAVLNATIPAQQIPIDVQPRLAGQPPAAPVTGTAIALDAATLTAITGAIGAVVAIFTKQKTEVKKGFSRDDAVADTISNTAESLKATDYGAADTANVVANQSSILTKALAVLPGVPEEIKSELEKSNQDAQQNAKEWNHENKEYYENQSTRPRPGELEGCKVKTKLAQVNKMTEKTPDP